MKEEELLAEVFARRLIITGSGQLWAPHTYVPQEIRSAIRTYRATLVHQIKNADIRLCPAHDAHRREWYYRRGQWRCGACERLNPLVC